MQGATTISLTTLTKTTHSITILSITPLSCATYVKECTTFFYVMLIVAILSVVMLNDNQDNDTLRSCTFFTYYAEYQYADYFYTECCA